RLPALAQHAFQIGGRLFVEEQLPWVGPALFENRSCLAPDQLGPTSAETAVATEGQFVGSAVEGAIAAFHRLDAQGVAGSQRTDRDGAKERAEVVAEAEIKAQALTLGLQFFHGAKFEIASQGADLP